MGQKIKPNSLRIGVTKSWLANWFPKKLNFKLSLEEDVLLRKLVEKKIGAAGINKILIEKTGNNYRIFIKAARPGLIIGRGGKGVEELTKLLENKLKKLRKEKKLSEPVSLSVNIEELKRSEVSAVHTAQQLAWDLEKRMPFRWTTKKYVDQVFQNKDVKGVRITVSGRLDGGEIARRETMRQGSLPLQTLRADIDYGQATAFTTYGTVGIKVWIYKGEVFNKEKIKNKN